MSELTKDNPALGPNPLAITAAEITSIQSPLVKDAASSLFAHELYQQKDWKTILQSAKHLESSHRLPVITCGRPLASKQIELFAQSYMQVQKIQDNFIRGALNDILKVTLARVAVAVKSRADVLKAERFNNRLKELAVCNGLSKDLQQK